MPRNVWMLFLAQAMAFCVTPLMVFAGALASRDLAPSPAWATLPIAAVVIGTALTVYPASLLSKKLGRKAVFMLAMVVGMIATLVSMFSLQMGLFSGFVGGSLLIGVVVAGVQQFRFAAMESVEPKLMPLAASRLLTAGLVAAVLGPELVPLGQMVIDHAFSGAFLLMTGLYAAALLVLAFGFKNPQPQVADKSDAASEAPPLLNIGFLVASMSAGIGFGVMSFIMTATPISMYEMQGFTLNDTKLVIQSHILAMFIPSLFAGRLILWFGHVKLIVVGLLAFVVCVGLGMWDHTWLHYWWSLVLLGIGWNFLFVAGTSLLPKMYTPGQAYRAQGVNDAIVFTTQGVGALSSSVVLYTLGWSGLLLVTLPFLLLMLVLVMGWVQVGKPDATTQPARIGEQ